VEVAVIVLFERLCFHDVFFDGLAFFQLVSLEERRKLISDLLNLINRLNLLLLLFLLNCILLALLVDRVLNLLCLFIIWNECGGLEELSGLANFDSELFTSGGFAWYFYEEDIGTQASHRGDEGAM